MVKCTPEQALEIVALDTALERLAMLKIHVERRGGGDPTVLRIWAVDEFGIGLIDAPAPLDLERELAGPLLHAIGILLKAKLEELGAR